MAETYRMVVADGPYAGQSFEIAVPAAFPLALDSGGSLYWPRVEDGKLVLTLDSPSHPSLIVAWMLGVEESAAQTYN